MWILSRYYLEFLDILLRHNFEWLLVILVSQFFSPAMFVWFSMWVGIKTSDWALFLLTVDLDVSHRKTFATIFNAVEQSKRNEECEFCLDILLRHNFEWLLVILVSQFFPSSHVCVVFYVSGNKNKRLSLVFINCWLGCFILSCVFLLELCQVQGAVVIFICQFLSSSPIWVVFNKPDVRGVYTRDWDWRNLYKKETKMILFLLGKFFES